MKHLFLVLAFFAIGTANAMLLPVSRSTVLKYDGSVDANTIEKHFIKVKNGAGSTLAAGSAVIWDLTADDGATVTAATTSGASLACIIVNACSSAALCDCQKYGLFDAALFDSTNSAAVAGQRFWMSTSNAGYISARSVVSASEVAGGVFYDAASASGSVQIFINL